MRVSQVTSWNVHKGVLTSYSAFQVWECKERRALLLFPMFPFISGRIAMIPLSKMPKSLAKHSSDVSGPERCSKELGGPKHPSDSRISPKTGCTLAAQSVLRQGPTVATSLAKYSHINGLSMFCGPPGLQVWRLSTQTHFVRNIERAF